ncbi:MAG: histidine--tRNA ligase [Patescibacteria group bacterium]
MSNKIQVLKGFRDFLPVEARKRQWLRAQMIKVFEKWGYEPLETPTLEPYDLFKGEVGEDEKLFYKFKDLGDREVMLRYDQTVPTCRVIGQYANEIKFPFRRYQIQSNFRAEKPQAGRFREFVQADIDIFGIASPLADAEAIAVSLDLYRSLGFKKAVAVINSRDLMKGVPYEAIVAIDKLKKIGVDGIIADMVAKGIDKDQAQKYFDYVKNIQPDETIKTIFEYLKSYGFDDDWYSFEPTLARSFSYSQGPIWEMVIPEYPSGSVGGGERYDGMMKRITGKDIPATGIAFGFDRTLEAIEVCGLLPKLNISTQVLVTVFSPELRDKAIELSTRLRRAGVGVELYPDDRTKLEKQLKYANAKSIPFVTILGPEEIRNKTVKLKNMDTGEQKCLPDTALISIF